MTGEFPKDGGFYIRRTPPVFYLLDSTNIRETWAVFRPGDSNCRRV
jgi:hypothetical protein